MSVTDLQTFFPAMLRNMEIGGVCNFCYASLKHYWPVVQALPASVGKALMLKFSVYQPQWQNAAWSVVCGQETEHSVVKATGIPPNVHVLQRCLQMYHAIESLPDRVRESHKLQLSHLTVTIADDGRFFQNAVGAGFPSSACDTSSVGFRLRET